MFSNKGETTGSSSIVYELQLDTTAKAATVLWRYDAGISTGFGGDVQRLDNGNTLITYSVSGVIQELGPDGALLQSFTYPLTAEDPRSVRGAAGLLGGVRQGFLAQRRPVVYVR